MSQHILAALEQPESISSECLAGKVLGIDCVYPRGITEELLSVKKHGEVILDKMSEGILEMNAEGRIVYANPAALSLTQTPLKDLLGRSFVDLFSGDDHRRISDLLKTTGVKTVADEAPVRLSRSQITLKVLPLDEPETSAIIILHDVTQRKQAESGLKSAREYAQNIIDSSLDMIISVDNDRRIVEFNKAAETAFGYRKEEVVGKSVNILYADIKEGRELRETALKNEDYIGEITNISKDGNTFTTLLSIAFMRGKNGEVIGSVGVSRDITEQKRIQKDLEKHRDNLERIVKERTQKLRESEKRYRMLFERAGDAIFLLEAGGEEPGKIVEANHAAAEMHGYAMDELIGLNIKDLNTPGEAQIAQERIQRMLKGEWINTEINHRRKDGSIFPIEVSAGLLELGDQKYILAFDRDVTMRKRSEELQILAAKKWANTFDAIQDMIVIVDKEKHITQTNQAFQDTFPDLTLQKPCKNIFDGASVLPECCDSCDISENRQSSKFEYYDSRLDRWFNLTVYPIKNENGRVEQLVHIFVDITAHKQALDEKDKLVSQLQRAEKMEAIGTLAGGVAHDLNNILSGILSYPELILLDLPDESPLKKPISTIHQSGQRAAAIVQDLLTLARRGVVVDEVVNLNEIVKDYLKSAEFDRLVFHHPNVQIETDLRPNSLNILGSPIHLIKTIMNLVSNAVEAIKTKGTVTISVKNKYIDRPIKGYDTIEEGDYVVLKVADNGVGILPEHIGKIFEPFYSKKKMGRSGTGLGMAVIWGSVRDHKGFIDLQSTVGEGTTFTLYFPVTRKEIIEEKTPITIENYMGNKELVLIVDDVAEQREIASNMLTRLGYDVKTASSGEEAIAYLKNNPAELLVLDMIMAPGIDGLETYKRILEFHPKQKAIIASGFSETDHVKAAQKLGAGPYIRKPYTLEKIGLAVMEELSK
ncbi:PAS domain S-box protein [Thermodesulfobacteriota bacterium]